MNNNIPLPMDNQGRWYELLSPTQVLTGQDTNENMNVHSDNNDIVKDEELEEHAIVVNDDIVKNIPYYLLKGNKSFEQVVINQVSSPDLIEELRQMAIVIYQLSMIDLQKSLWMTYLKSGTGKLKSIQTEKDDNDDDMGPSIWPLEVQSTIQTATNENDGAAAAAACLTYVTDHLSDLDKKMEVYQTELTIKKTQLSDYIPSIEIFIHQGLESTRLEIQNQIALVQYNYNDHVLELEYLQHNPTQDQQRIAKQLCHAKYHEEITKEEFNLLKQHITISKSSESTELPTQETFSNTIENEDIRRKLHDLYMNVAQQAKEDIINFNLCASEAQMNRYHQQFQVQLQQFWSEQRSLPNDQKLSNIMIHLIEQRYKNVSESVKCVYKYRADLMHLNSTTNQ